jgi:hypothetical protein
MLTSFDFDATALLAMQRHAELLAAAMKAQEMRQLPARRSYLHAAGQWLRRIGLGRGLHQEPLDACAPHRSVLQG